MAKDYGSSVGRSVGRAIGKAAVGAVFRPRRRRRVQATVARSQAGGCSGSGAFIIVLGIFSRIIIDITNIKKMKEIEAVAQAGH